MGEKRILFAASKYDYADPSLGLSNEYYFYYDTLRHMRGVEVKIFDWVKIVKKVGRDRMNNLLYEKVLEYKPHLVIFLVFREEFKKEVVRKITKEGKTITLNFFTNDLWQFDHYSRYWAPCFTWITTYEKPVVRKYRKIGYKNVILSHWAANPKIYRKLNLPYKWDVSFVGQAYGNRKGIIRGMKKAGISVEAFGRGFKNRKISFAEMIRVFNQSKINLNISEDVKKLELFRFLPEILQPPTVDPTHFQLKARIFEITGSGGFLLTTYGEPLRQYFLLGKEIETYRSFEELIEKIRFYLENEELREKIAKAGYERTIKEYTYDKRFSEIFKKIGLLR